MNTIWDEKRNGSKMVIVKWVVKMATILKNAYSLKRSSSPKLWANCLETWYVASGTVVPQNLYKRSPWVDLDLIYSKVNFGSIGI